MSSVAAAVDRYFGIRAAGSTFSTEVRAGLTTFLTMAYILAVNPAILSGAGMPVADVTVATALSAAIATGLMALWARLPFALAPGMGLNAYFVYGICVGMGVNWQTALAAVFFEGLLFLALSLSGWRSQFLDAIPAVLKAAICAGIGLFLALVGLEGSGIVVDHPVTLVTLGPLLSANTALTVGGILLAGVLLARRVPGALLIVIATIAAVAWGFGLAPRPVAILSAPSLPRETLFALDFGAVLQLSFVPVIVALFFVDLLDTAGSLAGAARFGGLLRPDGSMPRSGRAFTVDAVGTSVGAVLGTSTVTTYIESATGIEEGGRTGLTAAVVSLCFLAALLFTPVFVAIPPFATAPALVAVGALMMGSVGDINWHEPADAIPAFLTIAIMPLSFSIAHGLVAGMVAWVGLRLASGRWREVRPAFAVTTLLLAALAVWTHQ